MTDSTKTLATGADGTQHQPAELVVDSGDADNVVALVNSVRPMAASRDRELETLELTLVRIDSVERIVAELPTTSGFSPGPAGDPLETLMAWIRSEGPLRFGKVPEMGKNRVVLGGEGRPIPSPTGPVSSPVLLPSGASGPFPIPPGALLGDGSDAPFGARNLQGGQDPTEVAQDFTRSSQSTPAGGEDSAGGREDPSAVVVGVLDSSVIRDKAFADLVTFPRDHQSELAAENLTHAFQGHGTFVTGLVNQQARTARICVRAILNNYGFATAWDAAEGMAYLASHADVINMSVGTITGDGQPPFALQRAVERLHEKVVLVAAVGNIDPASQRPTPLVWPAALHGVLAVGSVTRDGATSAFSPQEPWVDVAAVGENVRSTFTSGDVVCALDGGGSRTRRFWGAATWSGTSFAAATVTGRLAQLACEEISARKTVCTRAERIAVIRELADRLRTGELPDSDVRQP